MFCDNLNAKSSLSILFLMLHLWYISDLPKVKIEQWEEHDEGIMFST